MKNMWCLTASTLLASATGAWAAEPPGLQNPQTAVRAVTQGDAGFVGFDVLARAGNATVPVAEIRWTSGARWFCRHAAGTNAELVFQGFGVAPGHPAPEFGPQTCVRVRLAPSDPFPLVAFVLDVAAFDEAAWRRDWQALCPFYFLRCSLPPTAAAGQLLYQGGELYPGPEVDPFPITMGPMRGNWSERWSYAPALGAAPVPAVGLWAPESKLFVAYEFQDSRSGDHSETFLASSYCAGLPDHPGQFFSLSYPHARQWLQLRLPAGPCRIESRFRLLYSRELPSDSDPNRFVLRELLQHYGDRLPPAPRMNDMSWLRQDTEASQRLFLHDLGLLPDHPRQRVAPGLWRPYESCEKAFFDPGAVQLAAHQTGKQARYAAVVGDTEGLAELRRQVEYLLPKAKQERFGDDVCWVWEHPVEGQFKASFGGRPATGTRHMFNWGIASALLWLHRQQPTPEYLPFLDGMVRWSRHYLYDRAGMADLPWAVFSMGAANGGELLLDYAYTFRDDPERRDLAAEAWRLAEVIVYRNIYAYTGDPDPADTLDPSFLLQAVNSHYWLGQVTWGEMGRIPEMAIQMYLETGDPYFRYLVRGCLERFYLGTVSPNGDYAENLSVFGEMGSKGTTSGGWGGNNFRWLAEPLGSAMLQVDVGPRGAVAFCRGTCAIDIRDYAFAPEATYAFTLTVDETLPGAPRGAFDIMVTSPRRSLRGATVLLNGQPLTAERFTVGTAGTDALVRGVRNGDRVQIGDRTARPTAVALREFRTRGAWEPLADTDIRALDLRELAHVQIDDRWAGDWGGLVPGPMVAANTPFSLIDATAAGGQGAVALAPALRLPVNASVPGTVAILLGAPHAVPADAELGRCSIDYADGTSEELRLATADGILVRQGMEWYEKDWWLRAFAIGCSPTVPVRSLQLQGPALLFAVTLPATAAGARGLGRLAEQIAAAQTEVDRRERGRRYQSWQLPAETNSAVQMTWWDPRWPWRFVLRLDPAGQRRRNALVRIKEPLDLLLAQVGETGTVDPATVRAWLHDDQGKPVRELEAQFCPGIENPRRGELLLRLAGAWDQPLTVVVYLAPVGSAVPTTPASEELTFSTAGGVATFGSGAARLAFQTRGEGPGPRLVELAFGTGPNLLAKAGWDEGFGHLCACQDGVTWYDFGALQTRDAKAEVVSHGPLAMTVRIQDLDIYGAGDSVAINGVGTAGKTTAALKGTAEWFIRLYADDPRVDSWVRYTIHDPDTRWTRPLEVRFGTASKAAGQTTHLETDGVAVARLGGICIIGLDDEGELPARPYFTGEDGAVLSVQFSKPLFAGTYVTDRWRLTPDTVSDTEAAAEAAWPDLRQTAIEVLRAGQVARPQPRDLGATALGPDRDWALFLPEATSRRFEAGQPDTTAGLTNRDNSEEGTSARETISGRWCLVPGKTPTDTPQRFIYFDLRDLPADPALRRRAWILIEYFDRGRGVVSLEYDSADPSVHKSAAPGAFKDAAGEIRMTDTRAWRTHVFIVDDANFENRCNGADFRLQIRHGALAISRLLVSLPATRSGAAPP